MVFKQSMRCTKSGSRAANGTDGGGPLGTAATNSFEPPAGAFSPWLRHTRRVLSERKVEADVPCGDCNACCRAGYFIEIHPDEQKALDRIGPEHLSRASDSAGGSFAMEQAPKGKCPMLINNACSIYEDRPQTCRSYDCRVFAATGIRLKDKRHAAVAEQAFRWQFEYPTDLDGFEASAVREAAAFLQTRGKLFPRGALPTDPGKLARLALQIHGVFMEQDGGVKGTATPQSHGARSEEDLVEAVLNAMMTQEAGE